MNFSHFLGIPAGHEHLNFVDAHVDCDTPLFIDPCLIEQGTDPISREAADYLTDFADRLCSEMRNGNWECTTILDVGHEINETKLGYGNGMNGKGKTGRGMRESLNDLYSLANRVESISKVQDIPVFVNDFAEDCMSDLETNILRGVLTRFTEEQMKLFGIEPDGFHPTTEWSINEHNWVNRTEPYWVLNGVRILLVPKQWVRKHFLFSTDSYFTRIVLEHLQESPEYQDWKKVEIVKQFDRPNDQWKYRKVVDFADENPDSLLDYHRRMPAIYNRYGGQMLDDDLDEVLYGHQMQ